MSNLARTYSVMGRPQDALRLDENAYELMKRALAKDDPQMGGRCISLECHHALTRMYQQLLCTILGCHTVTSAGSMMRWCCSNKRSTFDGDCCLRIILR